ncbi:hypothetical protein BSKO_09634 [Bryopsis sp. KO-2023]|nr:hypothetical protein BSKO_09634 [Bryopsis sp. KO-2023]
MTQATATRIARKEFDARALRPLGFCSRIVWYSVQLSILEEFILNFFIAAGLLWILFGAFFFEEASSDFPSKMETPPRYTFGRTCFPTIPERYRVDDSIEFTGSIGVLKAAESDGGPVVLKMPHPYVPGTSIPAIRREARILAAVQHPNIVSMVEYIEDEHILVLERLGCNLDAYLREHGQPCLRKGFEMLQQMLEGLNALHEERIVHCDLAPRNVVFKENELVLIDFNVAREFGDYCAKLRRGDPDFLEAKPSMDIFNLGLVMVRIFSETLPPSPYKDFVDMFLEDDPERRPTAADALLGTAMALELLMEAEKKRMRKKRKLDGAYDDWNIVHQHAMPRQKKEKISRRE